MTGLRVQNTTLPLAPVTDTTSVRYKTGAANGCPPDNSSILDLTLWLKGIIIWVYLYSFSMLKNGTFP